MFLKKVDLDKHILDFKSRCKNDVERKMRGLNFAKLYFMNKEYKTALRYINDYLSINDDCAVAYKLQGKIYENLMEKKNAFTAYCKSLEIDGSQKDLFEKILDLMDDNSLDSATIKLWTERAQQSMVDNDFIEKLKICSPYSFNHSITQTPANNSYSDCIEKNIINTTINESFSSKVGSKQSTPVSDRFSSPMRTSSSSNKIEKKLLTICQSQELMADTLNSMVNQFPKEETGASNRDILNTINAQNENIQAMQNSINSLKQMLEKSVQPFLFQIQERSVKTIAILDQLCSSQTSLEDAFYEFSGNYLNYVCGNKEGHGPMSSMESTTLNSSINQSNLSQNYTSVSSSFQPQSPDTLHKFSNYPQNLSAGSTSNVFSKLGPIGLDSKAVPFQEVSSIGSPTASAIAQPHKFQIPITTSTEPSMSTAKPADNLKPLSELFKPTVGSWECSACYVRNNSDQKLCVSCETPKPGCEAEKPSVPSCSFKFGFSPSQDTNKHGADTSKDKMPPISDTSSSGPTFSFLSQQPVSSSPFSLSSTSPNVKSSFQFGSSQNYNFSFNRLPIPKINEVSNDPEIEIVYVKEPTSKEVLEKVKKYQLPINFYDYENAKPCPGCRGCEKENENGSTFKFTPVTPFVFNEPPKEAPLSTTNLFSEALAAQGIVKTEWDKVDKPWSFSTNFTSPNKEGNDQEEETATIDFKPVIPLPDLVDVKTGEEDETSVFHERAKIFRYDNDKKEWKERGVGEFKILKHNINGRYRLLLRRDKVLKIACNHYLTPMLKFKPMANTETSVCWFAIDYSDGQESHQQFAIRFKTKDILNSFLNKIKELQNELSNQSSGDKVVTPSLQSPEKEVIEKAKSPVKVETKIESKPPKEISKEPARVSANEPHSSLSSIFQSTSNDSKSDSSEAFKNTKLFADAVAAHSSIITPWPKVDKPSWMTPQLVPVFAFSKEKEEHVDEEGEYTSTADFKPVIPLPALVEAKTGEEDETPIFHQRGKIFRYDTDSKQWKERGVGEFKILKHNTNDRYRLLLRRDQVLKIACNHYLTPELIFKPLNNSETSVCWYAVDYSDDQESYEQLAIKFKTKEILSQFLEKVEEVKKILSEKKK